METPASNLKPCVFSKECRLNWAHEMRIYELRLELEERRQLIAIWQSIFKAEKRSVRRNAILKTKVFFFQIGNISDAL